MILAEGLDERIVRTREAATRVRDGLRDLGFVLFVDDEHASLITTSAHPHPDLPVDEMIVALREEHDIYISGGLAGLAGKIFRIGHMGRAIEAEETDLLLNAIAEILAQRRELQTDEHKESAGVDGASV
jgi:aspartate aminotransferase-like enzyme